MFSTEKLISYGFESSGGIYTLTRDILDGQLTLTVTHDGTDLTVRAIDPFDGSDYTLHHAEKADVPFVSSVRYEIDRLIYDIKLNCWITEHSPKEQKSLIFEYCHTKYGDSFEYLWDTSPDAAAIRRKDNRKWYGVLMRISSERLGLTPHRELDIINLHVKPEELPTLIEAEGIFPAYHMSKKHWVTVILDGSVDTEKVFSMIDESYSLGGSKKSRHTTKPKGKKEE